VQVAFQVGANASQTISVTFADLKYAMAVIYWSIELGYALEMDVTKYSIADSLDSLDLTSAASTAITYIDTALGRVDAHRATLGATINRLEYAADNLSNVAQNTSASRSRILDADYASETTELARTQIIQQAATAMLSQANQQAQSVLALLK
jgi:flagellin